MNLGFGPSVRHPIDLLHFCGNILSTRGRHGGLMFVIGKPVKGGHYGEVPSLTELSEGDNLRHTTDFRRVYATATAGWLGYPDTRGLLGEDFAPFPLFG